MPIYARLRSLLSSDRRLLLALLGLALLLRLGSLCLENFHHPDEIWQYLEPAYRLASGRWVVAWEYRDGIRTWLIPLLLAGPMKLGAWLAPESLLYLQLPRLLMVLLSLSVVASACVLGLRISRLHGALAGLVAAIWAELVYFAPRTLSEPVALALFFPAAALLTLPRARRGARVLLLAGLLLGLCFSARFQLAPALGVLALWAAGPRWRDWGWLVLGALLGLAIDAAVDAAVGGHPPLRWIYQNFAINLLQNKSASFGVDPPYWYLTRIANTWRLALLAIVPLSILGARRYPVLMAVALVNLLAHSLIPHKEYRFVLLSVAVLVVLAALGSADLVERRALARPGERARMIGRCVLLWCLASLLVACAGPLKHQWHSGRALIQALRLAGQAPPGCGMALVEPPHPLTAAYVLYHRDGPIYLYDAAQERAAALRDRAAFDTVLSRPGVAALAPDYRLLACTGAYCVYRRPGTCEAGDAASHDVNRVLAVLGR